VPGTGLDELRVTCATPHRLGYRSLHRTRRSLTVAAALLGFAAASLVPDPTAAQEPAPGESAGGDPALAAIGVDVLKAESTDVGDTLVEIRENVTAQRDALSAALDTLTAAENALAAADAALADTQSKLDAINVDTDLVVVDAFLNPPYESAWDSLAADSLMDLTVKQTLLDREADADAEKLDEYIALQEQLETQRDEQEAAAQAAGEAAATAQAAYDDVEAASSQQALFAVEVDRRLDRNLAEAAALEDTDPELAAQIRAREGELAAALQELDDEVQAERAQARAAELAAQAEAVRNSNGIRPVPGGVTDVGCPTGGVVQVAGDIARQVERLLADAAAAGYPMCGKGYRDPADQIRVRQQNCGTSTYAIYQAPSSYCSPPTARPGTSLHEQGLAVDFTSGQSTIGYSSGGYTWLKANASTYGLYNLPGEPWHWSVDGN
jgi:LAS superfamily LD-carboxypeptidase LdcB